MPVKIYEILLETWHKNSRLRPSFNELSKIFERILQHPEKFGLANPLKMFSSTKINSKVELVGSWSRVGFQQRKLEVGTKNYQELVTLSRKVKSSKIKTPKNEPDVYVITEFVEEIGNDLFSNGISGMKSQNQNVNITHLEVLPYDKFKDKASSEATYGVNSSSPLLTTSV